MSVRVKLNNTARFAVLDVPSVNQPAPAAGAAAGAHGGRDKTRLTAEKGSRISKPAIRVGGAFVPTANPPFLETRAAAWDALWAVQEAELAQRERAPIVVTLPDGREVEGVSNETTPLEVATGISQGLANACVVAKVTYADAATGRDEGVVAAGLEESADDNAAAGAEAGAAAAAAEPMLWDMTRPLAGSCRLELLKFDDPEGQMVFWHSSAHVLGECLECKNGCQLCVGPPVENGFFYDAYMGDTAIADADFKLLDAAAKKVTGQKQVFQRLVLSKAEALELFSDNPFKLQLIQQKIPDGGRTTAYKCGPLIDLCPGPHVAHTGKIKAFAVTRVSSSYFLGNAENDTLQRVYGVSFPSKGELKDWKKFQEEAAARDHRKLGREQKLFFFDQMSPGSAFFLPHGTRVYNKLMDFIRSEYRLRGYDEVVTPNVFNFQLWEQSGHALHYRDDMFLFECEHQEFGLKPMNCPGHCLIFKNTLRSYRELPIRMADFGVLHRNELSGALSGLTRVRRFCQDDAHIFCRSDQIQQEVLGALEFMQRVYGVFGMTFKLELSTRPDKALGDIALWDQAEAQLADALNQFVGAGNWRVNPKDGAFYGPKVDIKVYDAMQRKHQCATVQLDFQLPIRFGLKYQAGDESDSSAMETPVIVHRAMLGSVERFLGVLIEHYGGKWPLWISPRQLLIVPVAAAFLDYADSVRQFFHDKGYYVDVERSNKTLNKKIREGQLAQYNFIMVVGENEANSNSVAIRERESNTMVGVKTLDEAGAYFDELVGAFQ